jgi:hypothetical protein
VNTFLIPVHCVAALVGLVTIIVLSKQPASYYQKILSLTGICSFLGILAYLLELCSNTKEEAFLAARFGYVGKSFAMVLFLIFVTDYCGFPLKKKFKTVLLTYSTLLMITVLTSPYHKLYYTSVEYINNGSTKYLKL